LEKDQKAPTLQTIGVVAGRAGGCEAGDRRVGVRVCGARPPSEEQRKRGGAEDDRRLLSVSSPMSTSMKVRRTTIFAMAKHATTSGREGH